VKETLVLWSAILNQLTPTKKYMDLKNETAKPTSATTKEKGMLDNNTYNLVEQLAIENKSLWRIKNNYKNDSSIDTENKNLRNFIEKDKEELVKLLTEKLRAPIILGVFL
jgi:hypothetical protein